MRIQKPNRRAVAILIVICVALVATVGCLSKAKKVDSVNQMDTETVVMKDMAVTTNVALKKEWSEEVNGLLKAHIILRNKRNTTVKLEIMTVFKDSNGVPITGSTETWAPVMIQSNEDYHYERLCTVKGAVDYQFIIKTAGK